MTEDELARPLTAEEEARHTPHHGTHDDGYACGLSGPHCWACNEPWPCRSSGVSRPEPDALRAVPA